MPYPAFVRGEAFCASQEKQPALINARMHSHTDGCLSSHAGADSVFTTLALCGTCVLCARHTPPSPLPVTFCAPPKRALSSFMPWFTSMICAPAMSCIAIDDVMMGAMPVRQGGGGGGVICCSLDFFFLVVLATWVTHLSIVYDKSAFGMCS